MRFRSEVDTWFIVLYAFLAWRLGWPLLRALVTGGPVAPGLVVAAVVALGGIAYVAATTTYTLTEEAIVVRCGPSRTVVRLAAIQTIRASRSLLAAPALSLDRLEVVASPGPWLLISPADRPGFLREVLARAPHVRLEGLSVDASSRVG